MRCIASLRVHVVYCEPDATACCDASPHDAGIELESIQVFFNDAMQRVMYIVNPPLVKQRGLLLCMTWATCKRSTVPLRFVKTKYTSLLVNSVVNLQCIMHTNH